MKAQNITSDDIIADYYYNEDSHPRKAIILLGGSEGGNSFSRLKIPIKHFVSQGYAVLCLAYFKAKDLPRSLEEIPLEYFERAMEWLSNQAMVFPDQFAVIGGSKGAELSLLLASNYYQIKTVVALSPSSVVWQGIPRRLSQIGKDPKSSWSFQGAGLPYVSSSITKKDLGLMIRRKLLESAIKDLSKIEKNSDVYIPVERMHCPLLLLSAERDQVWPSTLMAYDIVARLKEKQFDYPFEHHSYPCGHQRLFMKRDAWRRIFGFIENYFPATYGNDSFFLK